MEVYDKSKRLITNVLSLFDGISCGQIALNRAGVAYETYYASEIDKNAIKVTQSNYPNTVQLGEVSQIKALNLPQIDLLIGGSPCQGFSFIGKGLNFNDPRSCLFFEFLRLLEECKPKYWLLENVVMKKEHEQIISSYLKVKPSKINSALVSAQNRIRLYWTNLPIPEIKDRLILLDDIIEESVFNYKTPKNWKLRVPPHCPKYVDPYNKNEIKWKSTTLRTNIHNGNMWVRTLNGYRNLTRNETERLQTLGIGYTDVVTECQGKKLISNAWTVDIIANIFKTLVNGKISMKNAFGDE